MTDAIVISRKALYAQVWAKPMIHLAKEFGLSGTGLTKLCRRNEIPLPVQGFWNRREDVRRTEQIALPDADRDCDITIQPSPAAPPKVEATSESAPSVIVPQHLLKPHALIRRTKAFLETAYRDEHGRFRPGAGCLDILVSPGCRRKAYLVMDTVLKECEKRGWSVKTPDGNYAGTVVNVNGGEVKIELEESLRREPRERTADEKKEDEQRGRPKRYPLYTYFPSGKLTLSLNTPSSSGRYAWREGTRFTLNKILSDLMTGLEEAGEWKKQCDIDQAKAEERRQEQERLRWEQQKACMAEQERVDRLFAQAEAWDRSQKLRSYIDARTKLLKSAVGKIEKGSEADKWITWAQAQADRLDPMIQSPPSILDQKPPSFWNILGASDDWWRNWHPRGGSEAAWTARRGGGS